MSLTKIFLEKVDRLSLELLILQMDLQITTNPSKMFHNIHGPENASSSSHSFVFILE